MLDLTQNLAETKAEQSYIMSYIGVPITIFVKPVNGISALSGGF